MKESGKRRLYLEQFKKEAVSLVIEHGYSIVQAAQVVGTSEKNLQRWVKQQAQGKSGERLDADERAELQHLRREVKTLRMEKEILKKASVDSTNEANDNTPYVDRLIKARNNLRHETQKLGGNNVHIIRSNNTGKYEIPGVDKEIILIGNVYRCE